MSGCSPGVKRGQRYEDDLHEAETLDELNHIAARYEHSLMWKMIGPTKDSDSERMRTEIERDKFVGVAKEDPFQHITTEKASTPPTPSPAEPPSAPPSEPPSNEAAETTEVAASQVAIQVDEHGYEWKTETDGKYYRTAGSEDDWIQYEG